MQTKLAVLRPFIKCARHLPILNGRLETSNEPLSVKLASRSEKKKPIPPNSHFERFPSNTGRHRPRNRFPHDPKNGGRIVVAWKAEIGLINRGITQRMNTPATSQSSLSLTQSQKTALISLLADDDPAVYKTIRQTLLNYGPGVVAWLRPYSFNRDPILRRRAQELMQFVERQEADNQFVAFCLNQTEGLDVEMGAWRLAQTQYPDINLAAYQALLDSFAAELRERLGHHPGVTSSLATINEYLFSELGFVGNEQNYYDPDNSYLNRVIDSRTGNPISLCLLYLVLAKRLQLPVVGIGLPGHFLCRYQSPIAEAYIDVFNRGRLLTKAECIHYLKQAGHGYLDDYLSPITPRRMLLRICANLHQIYLDLELPKEVSRFQRYIVALSK